MTRTPSPAPTSSESSELSAKLAVIAEGSHALRSEEEKHCPRCQWSHRESTVCPGVGSRGATTNHYLIPYQRRDLPVQTNPPWGQISSTQNRAAQMAQAAVSGSNVSGHGESELKLDFKQDSKQGGIYVPPHSRPSANPDAFADASDASDAPEQGPKKVRKQYGWGPDEPTQGTANSAASVGESESANDGPTAPVFHPRAPMRPESFVPSSLGRWRRS